MFGVGIGFIIMGSTKYIIINKLNGKLPILSQQIYIKMFYAGIVIVLLSGVSMFISEPYSYVLPSLPVLYLGLYMITVVHKKLFNNPE